MDKTLLREISGGFICKVLVLTKQIRASDFTLGDLSRIGVLWWDSSAFSLLTSSLFTCSFPSSRPCALRRKEDTDENLHSHAV